MGIFGWLLTGGAIGLIWYYATENQWSNGKKWIGIIAVLFLSFACSGDNLKSKGKEYVLDNLQNPSSADFYSYTKSKAIRKMIKEDCNIEYEKDCDIIKLGVEATGGYGRRVKLEFLVFFYDGEPIDLLDADALSTGAIRGILGESCIEYEIITD